MPQLNKDLPDTTDPVGRKFRRGVDWVERALDDRWPAREKANTRSGEYRPLDDVSREGRPAKYRRYPSG